VLERLQLQGQPHRIDAEIRAIDFHDRGPANMRPDDLVGGENLIRRDHGKDAAAWAADRSGATRQAATMAAENLR
jgi:hypothetical protein